MSNGGRCAVCGWPIEGRIDRPLPGDQHQLPESLKRALRSDRKAIAAFKKKFDRPGRAK